MRRLSQTLQFQNQRVPPLQRCVTYGGDHSTQQCPVLPQQPLRQKWCAIEGKWTSHMTEECYYNKGHVRERPYHSNPQYQPNQQANPRYQQNRNAPLPLRYASGQVNPQVGAKRPRLVLGQQTTPTKE